MTDDERAAALDRLVDDALAGRPLRDRGDVASAVAVVQLAAAFHDAAPPAVYEHVDAAVRRARYQAVLPVRLAAFLLGSVFTFEALGDLVRGRWLADNLNVGYDAHASFEGGVVFLALAAVMVVAAMRPAWIDAAALAGVPAGLVLAAHGIPEFREFPEGGVVHATQGVAALAFGVTWWLWHRRYAGRPRDEGGSDE